MTFINNVMLDDPDYIKSLLNVLGYCITGDTNEQAFFVFIGNGSNGKTALAEILKNTLISRGSSMVANEFPYTVLTSYVKGSEHNADRAVLFDTRLAINSEFPYDVKINKTSFKQLSGTKHFSARPIGMPVRTARIYFKFMLFANDMIDIPIANDKAVARRFRYWTFKCNFIDRDNTALESDQRFKDPQLIEDILNNPEGVLKILVDHAAEYFKNGLKLSEKCNLELKELIQKQDYIGNFVNHLREHTKQCKQNMEDLKQNNNNEKLEIKEEKIYGKNFYDSFLRYLSIFHNIHNGSEIMSHKVFGEVIKSVKDLKHDRDSKGIYYSGLMIPDELKKNELII